MANVDVLDNRMWRQVLARVHPDRGGTEEEFVFLTEVKEALREAHKKKEDSLEMPAYMASPFYQQMKQKTDGAG